MSEDFKRLAEAVSSARNAKGWKVRDLAREAGLSQATIHGLERGSSEPLQMTKDRVAQALGWAPDSMNAILRGGEPLEDPSGAQSEDDEAERNASEA